MAHNGAHEWTGQEMAALKTGMAMGLPPRELARLIPTRTYRAVAVQANRLAPSGNGRDPETDRIRHATKRLGRAVCAFIKHTANRHNISEPEAQRFLLGPEPRAKIPGTETAHKSAAIARLAA